MLAWGMLSFGGGYNKSDLWAQGQATLRWNTDYLLKTVKDDPAGTAAVVGKKPQFYIVYQVIGCRFSQLYASCQSPMSTLPIRHVRFVSVLCILVVKQKRVHKLLVAHLLMPLIQALMLLKQGPSCPPFGALVVIGQLSGWL